MSVLQKLAHQGVDLLFALFAFVAEARAAFSGRASAPKVLSAVPPSDPSGGPAFTPSPSMMARAHARPAEVIRFSTNPNVTEGARGGTTPNETPQGKVS